MRKNRKELESESSVDVSPLLDMVFILLIFFVVTSTFTREAGVEVKKPQANSAQTIKDKTVQVAITKEGSIFIFQKQVDVTALESILKREKSKTPDVKGVIMADGDAVTGILVQVIDKFNLSGIKDVSIAALKE